MRKKKIYLDTSVISYLRQEDAPNEMQDTLEFWEILKSGKYEVYTSEVSINELANCLEPKRSDLFNQLSEMRYTEIEVRGNEEISAIAQELITRGVLPPKCENDSLHVAAAIFSGCNIIVSWNFKHLVNARTIDGVRIISFMNNLPTIDIYSPTMLLERGEIDE